MRIISGYYKGRILKSPNDSDEVRPTTDRAKETLFNILSNRYDFTGRTCLDLFCGTGNIGLEFLSRGINKCTFVDTDIKTVTANVNLIGIGEKSVIVRSEAIRFLDTAVKNTYDFIFADPPYKYTDYELLISKVSETGSTFIIEHDKNFTIPEQFGRNVFLRKKIGISNFTFLDFN